MEGKRKEQSSCMIMNETVGVIIEPTHILQIHRIPGEHGKIRPVIAELKKTLKLLYTDRSKR